MGWRDTLRELTGFTRPAAVTFSSPSYKPIDAAVRAGWFGDLNGRVSREEALSVPAVFHGHRLICGIATLPLEVRNTQRRLVRRPLLEQIDPDVPNAVTMAQTLGDLFFEGASFWRITALGADGFPVHAQHLDYKLVRIQPPGSKHASPSPLPFGHDPRDAEIWVDGEKANWRDIIMFPGLQPGILTHASRPIRRAVLLDKMATMYAENPRPLDFFTPAEGADPASDDEVAQILENWNAARWSRSTAYVPAALKYNEVGTPTPADMLLVEQQKQVYLEIANAMGLDPEDLGISTTSRTYQNDVSRRQDRINNLLMPFMTAVEQRLSMPDVTPRGHKVRFDLDEYLRPDPKTRAEVDQIRLNMGTTTVNEIREGDNLPALDAPTTPQRAVTPAPAPVPARSALSLSGDGPDATFSFDVPGAEVDAERRIITGLAVPYGQVGVNKGRRFRFAPGAITYSDIGRVKLLRDHDQRLAVGRALEFTETPNGLVGKFKIARGPEGDRVLALAEDGVLDGLSIGVDFAESDIVADPQNRGALLVRRALLREVSLTAMPAFDDSRVTSVAASRDTGEQMEPDATTEPQAPAAPAVAPDPEYAAFTAWRDAQRNQPDPTPPTPQPTPEPEPRPVVNPTRSLTTFVSEPLPYRFDRGGRFTNDQAHVFSADLHQMNLYNDPEGVRTDAGRRVMALLQATFSTISTDINELNPTIQRPDLYVDERDYRYTIWNLINKGAPPNGIQPFAFPKFNSASGLVGDHTEGVEPTPGEFTSTNQTVTPTALSGKANITREVWDMGGNPAVSTLIFNQMRKGWFEGLEQAAATFLATLTAATDITLTTAAADEALAGEWDAALAELQFERGYDFSAFAVAKTLYKKFVAAKDDVGRVLFPIINPVNANGTATTRFRALDLSGVIALPTWSLPTTGVGEVSSWLFDTTTVHGWATTPQRLEFPGVAVADGTTYAPVAAVGLGIWGYKAFANSDIGGVREVKYTP